MAIIQTIPASFLTELFSGTHDFSSDVFKLALYDSTATLGADTTAYSTTGEISGTGYSAGGGTVSVASGYPQVLTEGAWRKLVLDFDDVSWAGATFSAAAGLIYNSSKSNRAVCVIDLGGVVSAVSQTFTLVFPPPTFSDAIIQASVSTSGR